MCVCVYRHIPTLSRGNTNSSDALGRDYVECSYDKTATEGVFVILRETIHIQPFKVVGLLC